MAQGSLSQSQMTSGKRSPIYCILEKATITLTFLSRDNLRVASTVCLCAVRGNQSTGRKPM